MNTKPMRSSVLGMLFFRLGRSRLQRRLLPLIVRAEGGQMYSITLRKALARDYGVVVSPYSYGSLLTPLAADAGTEIGRYVSIGPNVRRFGAGHPIESASLHPFWYNPSLGVVNGSDDVPRTKVLIDHDAWIGANTLILPRVQRIGIGAVVAAGAVVTKDVADFEIVAGNPARSRGFRFDEARRAAVLAAAPWLLEPEDALRAIEALNLTDTGGA